MRIKTKLTLSVGLLFLLILLLGLVGAKYINALKQDTENILIANYNTLEYSRNMLFAMEAADPAMFEANLEKQEANLTEPGEQQATQLLRNQYRTYRNNGQTGVLQSAIRNSIFRIMDTNMEAIQRKSILAKNTARTATYWIAISGTLCFLIAFVLLVNLPASIANPIRELTESIKHIAAKKYQQRVSFESNGEFGELAASFNTMAEKLEEYDNSNLAILMKEKKRIETLINNMHDPVIGLDEQLKVLFANEEALKIIGIKEQDLLGRSAQVLSVQNDLLRTLIGGIITGNTPETDTVSKPVKIYADGRESYFEKEVLNITILPTGEKERSLIGYVIVLKNVTAYKELDFAKTNFIATVSHEFKTPISSMKMSLQLLKNKQVGLLNLEQEQLVESINDDAERLLKITGELLNMTQIESGNIQYALQLSDPKEIFISAKNATLTQANQKGIKLEINYPESLPMVYVDSGKMVWVLTNLVSNAIRYSYEGGIVSLSILNQKGKVLFVVKDTGQGIATKYKERVFDKYFRAPGTNKEGTGLGLAISKQLIEAQGGSISLESDYGSGSTFTVQLDSTV